MNSTDVPALALAGARVDIDAQRIEHVAGPGRRSRDAHVATVLYGDAEGELYAQGK